jgi:hypothetical protein
LGRIAVLSEIQYFGSNSSVSVSNRVGDRMARFLLPVSNGRYYMEWNETFHLLVMEFFLTSILEPNLNDIKPRIKSVDLRFSMSL